MNMSRYKFLLGAATLGIVFSSNVEAQAPMTKVEMENSLVGKSLVFSGGSEAHYGADGEYSFTSRAGVQRGKYTLSDGKICVAFPGGNTRCDAFTKEGDRIFFTNAKGEKSAAKIR
jgi:hypothetical protein